MQPQTSKQSKVSKSLHFFGLPTLLKDQGLNLRCPSHLLKGTGFNELHRMDPNVEETWTLFIWQHSFRENLLSFAVGTAKDKNTY